MKYRRLSDSKWWKKEKWKAQITISSEEIIESLKELDNVFDENWFEEQLKEAEKIKPKLYPNDFDKRRHEFLHTYFIESAEILQKFLVPFGKAIGKIKKIKGSYKLIERLKDEKTYKSAFCECMAGSIMCEMGEIEYEYSRGQKTDWYVPSINTHLEVKNIEKSIRNKLVNLLCTKLVEVINEEFKETPLSITIELNYNSVFLASAIGSHISARDLFFEETSRDLISTVKNNIDLNNLPMEAELGEIGKIRIEMAERGHKTSTTSQFTNASETIAKIIDGTLPDAIKKTNEQLILYLFIEVPNMGPDLLEKALNAIWRTDKNYKNLLCAYVKGPISSSLIINPLINDKQKGIVNKFKEALNKQ